MYTAVEKFPNFQSLERKILRFWEETRAFELLREQNRDKPIWSFLDGPITANNPMGVHHAWGRCLKDVYQRYHAMCGKRLRYQNGFDCQGLWVEVEVEKALGFGSKKDIEKYGMARFVEACKERVRKFSRVQTEQSIRLGYWMDWNDSYFTMTDENNYTIWSFLKKCHDRGFLYKGFDAMPWCPRCGVGLSQMEMHEGYKWVEHKSVFVRFPIRGRDREAFLVWTTTPWTLTSNVAVAVHPEMTYYKVKAGEWTYYVGAENFNGDRKIEVEEETSKGKKRRVIRLLNIPDVLKSQGEVEVLAEVPGKDLSGLHYDGPFDELEAQNEKGGYPYPNESQKDETGVTCHRAIAWEEVTGSEGSGIVHIAPGCGKEDFQLSQEVGLVSLSPLDEGGHFLSKYGWLEGRAAHDVADDIVASLKKKGILIGLENYPHRYAHCWRCATPVLYRQVDEWYIDMQWRDEIIKTVPQIRWIPEYGEQLEMDWLKNMGDWMISKKRYWGLALPIWRCEKCDWFTVIGGRDELAEKAVSGWDEFEGHTPHRPWVDAVKIKCEKCGAAAARIPDVGNPWLDAGIVPYSTMGWRDPEYWKQWFPADLVLECFPGQFRNWFYAMLAMSAMMQADRWADKAGGPQHGEDGPKNQDGPENQDGKQRRKQRRQSQTVPPFKTLLGHALVRDEEGREMHKSLGNAVGFDHAADTIGAEVMRYMFCSQNPSANLNFPDISEERKKNVVHLDQEIYRKLLTFWNCYSFYITYASVDQITPDLLKVPLDERSELDRWILSKFESLVGFAHGCFGDYRVHVLMERFERFLDNLSNWYIRRSRRRFWKSENDTEKMAAYATLFEILEGTCRLMAPILPFLAEEIYQNVVRSVQKDAPVSVHLLEYPQYDEKMVDVDLEKRIDTVIRYKNLGLSIRNKWNIKVRQPLYKILVRPETPEEKAALETETLRRQVLEEINVKELEFIDSAEGLFEAKVRPNFKVLGKKHGRHIKAIQAHLEQADPDVVRAAVSGGGVYKAKLKDQEIALVEEDIEVQYTGTGDYAVIFDNEAFLALDTNITPELKRESIARDFVRGVQIQRRDLDLHVADRIKVRYKADSESTAAVQEWSDYVCREVLALELVPDDSLTEVSGKRFKVGGKPAISRIVKHRTS